jgi:FkbM family methyltransferase
MPNSNPEPILIPLEECLAAYREICDKFGFSPVTQPGRMQLLGWDLEYVCGAALANFIDQILVRRLNDFFPDNDHPLILDCGANIGFTVLNYKRQFPQARIIAFEPDPLFAPVLRRNLHHNHADDVQVVEAAVWTRKEKVEWFSEGIDGSHIVSNGQENNKSWVQAIDLAGYLNETVDLLKIDIEGAEYDVVNHLGKELQNVKNILVECHLGQANIDRFGKMLQILTEAGFKLGINSFGAWRDLIRQTPVQPNHWEQYNLLAGWRVSNPLVSQAETLRPYGGAGLETELKDARDRLQDSHLALDASRTREGEYAEREHRLLQPFVKEFVTHTHKIESRSITGPFWPETGKCWMVPLPNLKNEADDEENRARSGLLLFEDEHMLEPAHSLHDDIRARGNGRYSHWKDLLYLSTSDGSDPNTNGRRYSVLYVTRQKKAKGA